MLTQEYLRLRFRYDEETGEFYWTHLGWKTPQARGKHQHTKAGVIRPDGYRVIRLDGDLYLAHRLIWFYHYGEWPKNEVDHIDRNTSNNRIKNLRDVPRAVNLWNSLGRAANGKGVMKLKSGRYHTRIYRGSQLSLGTFDTKEEAQEAYNVAARGFGGL